MDKRLFSIILVLILPACYEPQEGCLDPLAKNYDVSADEAGTCNYPSLIIDIEQIYDSLTFFPGRPLPAGGVDSIKIDTFQCLLSAFSLLDRDGMREYTTSRRTIDQQDGSALNVRDDLIAMKASRSSYTVGRFAKPGEYDSLRFQAGLPAAWKKVDLNSLPGAHPLNNVSKLALDEDRSNHAYLSLRIYDDSIGRFRAIIHFEPSVFKLSNSKGLMLDAGRDAELHLTFDYAKWTEAIDWANDSKAEIITILSERFAFSFQWTDE